MVDAVNLQAVTFQGAPLGEGLFAVVAPIWTHSCMCSCVPLQIECIIEPLSTEGAEVSLCIAVTLHVSIQQPRQAKGFSTSATGKPRRVTFASHWGQLFTLLLLGHVSHHWVLDPVTAVDELEMGTLGNAWRCCRMRIRCWRSLTLRRSSSSSVYPDVDFFLLEDPGGDPFIGLLLLLTTGDMGEGKQNASVSTLGSAARLGRT